MNNRIKELADETSEYVNTVYTPPIRSKTPGKMWEDGHVGWHTQFNQKFAQLIVKECDRYVAEHYDQMEPWTNSGHLLKHFGIEQQE